MANVHSFVSNVSITVGQTQGKTQLPLPPLAVVDGLEMRGSEQHRSDSPTPPETQLLASQSEGVLSQRRGGGGGGSNSLAPVAGAVRPTSAGRPLSASSGMPGGGNAKNSISILEGAIITWTKQIKVVTPRSTHTHTCALALVRARLVLAAERLQLWS
jgi:hypothetical protein